MSNKVVKSAKALIFSFKIQSQLFNIFSKIPIFNIRKNIFFFAKKNSYFLQCSKIVFSVSVFKNIILEKFTVINKLQNQKLNKTQHLAKQSQRNLPIPRRTFLQEAATQLAATKSRSKITAKNSSLEKTNKEDEEALF